MMKIRAMMARIFSYSGRHAKILNFTDKQGFLIILSVNENDFDKCSVSHHLLNHCT